jgi:hypothetical protein
MDINAHICEKSGTKAYLSPDFIEIRQIAPYIIFIRIYFLLLVSSGLSETSAKALQRERPDKKQKRPRPPARPSLYF